MLISVPTIYPVLRIRRIFLTEGHTQLSIQGLTTTTMPVIFQKKGKGSGKKMFKKANKG